MPEELDGFTPTTKHTRIDDKTGETVNTTRYDKESLLARQAYIIALRDKRKQHHDEVAQPELDEIQTKLNTVR